MSRSLLDIATSFHTAARNAVTDALEDMVEAGFAPGAIVRAKHYRRGSRELEPRIFHVTHVELRAKFDRYQAHHGLPPTSQIYVYGNIKRADGTFGEARHSIGTLEDCELLTPSSIAVTRALKKRGRI